MRHESESLGSACIVIVVFLEVVQLASTPQRCKLLVYPNKLFIGFVGSLFVLQRFVFDVNQFVQQFEQSEARWHSHNASSV